MLHRVHVALDLGAFVSLRAVIRLIRDDQIYGSSLTDRDMVKMVTSNPADAIAWTDKVGRVKKGLYADLSVYTKKPGNAYRSVIDATERDVRMVLVGGDPLFGDEAMLHEVGLDAVGARAGARPGSG